MIDRAAVINKLDFLLDEMTRAAQSMSRLDEHAYSAHPLGRTTELRYARKASFWESMLGEMLFLVRKLKNDLGEIPTSDPVKGIRKAAEKVDGLVSDSVPVEESVIALLESLAKTQKKKKPRNE